MERQHIINVNPNSAVNGTDDREARPEAWYVARVRMHCEKKTAQKITALGYESYVPTQEEFRQWSDRKKKIERILLPLIVFFRADGEGAKQVQRLSSVYDLLKAPGALKAAIIPDDQIKKLKFMIGNSDEDVIIEQKPIKTGDKVRVVRGSLKGLEGYATSSQDDNTKISIIVEDLFCASVKISSKDLIRIDQ